MINLYQKYFAIVLTALFVFTPVAVFASSDNSHHPMAQSWPHKETFGTYDKPSLQRGFQVYREVCAGCHSMNLLSYRNLAEIGFTADEIKAIAAEDNVMDGPNDEGEMFERPARPSDRFKAPFENEAQARFGNNGAYPPDLSLLVKARHGGEDYIFALLTGYDTPPAGETVRDGMYWNKYFKGNQIGMAPPLSSGLITYSNGKSASLEQSARDITQFLAWASEPNMEERKKMGLKVLLFLLVFSVIAYTAKRRIWAKIH